MGVIVFLAAAQIIPKEPEGFIDDPEIYCGVIFEEQKAPGQAGVVRDI